MSYGDFLGSGDGLPAAPNTSSPESFQLRLLREVFEELERSNLAALMSFDPNQPDAYEEVGLETSFSEVEEAEPEQAVVRRTGMLQSLGLDFRYLEEDDVDRVFQHIYPDGHVKQIRLLRRADGVDVPVYTAIGKSEDDNLIAIEEIKLLSYDRAAERRNELQDAIEESQLNDLLERELGLASGSLRTTDLDLDGKRKILGIYEDIAGIEVISPDTRELDKIRRRLVITMLPGTEFLSSLRAGGLDEAKKYYQKYLDYFIRKHGLDSMSESDLLEKERQLRIEALNRQVRARRRAAKVGIVAMSGFVTAVGVGIGAVDGGYFHYISSNSILESLILGGAGVAMGVMNWLSLRRHARGVVGFAPDYGEDKDLWHQLDNESALAEKYASKLRD